MPTKDKGQKDFLDRFYTPAHIVDKCLSYINLSEYDLIIEPSAGNGSFSNKIDNCLAIDICPQDPKIIKRDWFSFDKKDFMGYNNIIAIGNPPYGVQCNEAVKFFNHTAGIVDTIAFIIPASFRKPTFQNQLDICFHLKEDVWLGNQTFISPVGDNISLPVIFQIWKKKPYKRKLKKYKKTSEYIKFCDTKNRTILPVDADFKVQRVGRSAGKATSDICGSLECYYYIKNTSNLSNKELMTIINNLEYPTIDCVIGPKSLSKGEFIECLERAINGKYSNRNSI